MCIICDGADKEFVCEKSSYKIYRCTNCGFRFVDPLPTVEELNAYYKRNQSVPYLSKADAKIARTMKRIKRYMKLAPGKKFLDVGCNLGTGVKAADKLGLDAHGVDIDEESLEFAATFVPTARFHAGDISDMPAEWGNFDYVYSSEMIEHLPDAHAYFDALSKRMKKDHLHNNAGRRPLEPAQGVLQMESRHSTAASPLFHERQYAYLSGRP